MLPCTSQTIPCSRNPAASRGPTLASSGLHTPAFGSRSALTCAATLRANADTSAPCGRGGGERTARGAQGCFLGRSDLVLLDTRRSSLAPTDLRRAIGGRHNLHVNHAPGCGIRLPAPTPAGPGSTCGGRRRGQQRGGVGAGAFRGVRRSSRHANQPLDRGLRHAPACMISHPCTKGTGHPTILSARTCWPQPPAALSATHSHAQ